MLYNHEEGPYQGNYPKGQAALRMYANQPAIPYDLYRGLS